MMKRRLSFFLIALSSVMTSCENMQVYALAVILALCCTSVNLTGPTI